jgi:hypothetical protein
LDKNEIKAEADLKRMLEEKPDMTPSESDEYRKKDWTLDRAKLRKLDRLLIFEVIATNTNWKPPFPKEPEPMLKSFDHHEFTRLEGLKMLGITKMSPPNWEHAQARTRERISKHLEDKINWAAYFHHLDGHESADWQDHFVKPFGL